MGRIPWEAGVQESWLYFREVLLREKEQIIPMYRKNSKYGRRVNREIFGELKHKKKAYKKWKLGQMTREEYKNIARGYLPANVDRREGTLQRKRKEYFAFIEQYYDSRNDENHQDTYRQIHIDIPRMNPEALRLQPKVTEIFERILFIWAIRHPASGYVQGINDLVTPFFVVFVCEYIAGGIPGLQQRFAIRSFTRSGLRRHCGDGPSVPKTGASEGPDAEVLLKTCSLHRMNLIELSAVSPLLNGENPPAPIPRVSSRGKLAMVCRSKTPSRHCSWSWSRSSSDAADSHLPAAQKEVAAKAAGQREEAPERARRSSAPLSGTAQRPALGGVETALVRGLPQTVPVQGTPAPVPGIVGLSTLPGGSTSSDRCIGGRFSGSSKDLLKRQQIALPSTPVLHWIKKKEASPAASVRDTLALRKDSHKEHRASLPRAEGQLVAEEEVENFDVSSLPEEVLQNIEADSYWCMSKLLDGIQWWSSRVNGRAIGDRFIASMLDKINGSPIDRSLPADPTEYAYQCPVDTSQVPLLSFSGACTLQSHSSQIGCGGLEAAFSLSMTRLDNYTFAQPGIQKKVKMLEELVSRIDECQRSVFISNTPYEIQQQTSLTMQ
ncbi:TBC1 domain family member 22A [Chelonia mydas]|uniref:TBC1 domain family member 22A n=1 Tax=Chelonia mydas TaxID=8469 RepID=M7BXX7_CHEMY|nr:TBC1 domain family member 22A [Chelonia mydas]